MFISTALFYQKYILRVKVDKCTVESLPTRMKAGFSGCNLCPSNSNSRTFNLMQVSFSISVKKRSTVS